MPERPDYQPQPIHTQGIDLPDSLESLGERLAENNHDNWALQRMSEGWTWGEKRDDDRKTHPGLIGYADLTESEKEYDRITVRETLKAILATGHRILPPPSITTREEPGERLAPLQRHLFGRHPKRILALDGGGIKGVVTLGFLERLEKMLADRMVSSGKLQSPDQFRLCQYFDLIGGTSTGAIIAGALAMGMRASEIKEMYLKLSREVFKVDLGFYGLLLEAKRFDKRKLERHLERVFGSARLGGSELQTGLCVVAKRADSGSTWPLHNHPAGPFYKHNGPLMLWRVIRASTAAPTFFTPQLLPLGDRDEAGKLVRDRLGRMVQGAFVDGAVSMANNPSLQCLLLALLKGYGFGWESGEEKLLLVSVGTGAARVKTRAMDVAKYGLLRWVRRIPQLLMTDAFWQNQLLLQALSLTPTPWQIDSEVGDGQGGLISGAPLVHYLRYDVLLEQEFLQNQLGLNYSEKEARKLREMSKPANVEQLAGIGELAAKKQIPDLDGLAVHFPERFDTVIG